MSGQKRSSVPRPTVAYKLFMYREELRRPNAELLRLSRTKLHLTEQLVSYSADHITDYDVAELKNLNREIRFTHKLKRIMCDLRIMQKLQTLHFYSKV